MTAATIDRYPLDRALPPDVAAVAHSSWTRYRRYPVFSLPWLTGRLPMVVCWALGATASGTLATLMIASQGRQALILGGSYFIWIIVTLLSGPALATWIRHRFGDRREAIVAAILVGVTISYVMDWWATKQLAEMMYAARPE